MVKCRVTFKNNLGTHVIPDEHIKGNTLRVGAHVEAKHPDRNQYFEAVIGKLLDYSQYTVVFDDGDETTLRRTSLCLKSGRHFAESETLDQLPLTNPEHFGTPVMGSKLKRKRRSMLSIATMEEDSSDEESASTPPPAPTPPRRATPTSGSRGNSAGGNSRATTPSASEWRIGRVAIMDTGDKRKRDSWAPVLVVNPTGATGQGISNPVPRDDVVVRSFRDAKFSQVNRRELREFLREDATARAETNPLRLAVERALTFLDRGELPTGWQGSALLLSSGPAIPARPPTPLRPAAASASPASSAANDAGGSGGGNSAAAADDDGHDSQSDVSDDEPSEEKDRFVAQLYKFMDERGTPINKGPSMAGRDLNLYRLFRVVSKLGGCNRVTNHNQWKTVYSRLGLPSPANQTNAHLLRGAYKKYLQSFEDFYRKLGCTMVSNPRSGRVRHRSDRIMTRNQDRGLALFARKDKEQKKKEEKAKEEDKDKDNDDDKKAKEKSATAAATPPVVVKEEPPPEKPRPSRTSRVKQEEESSSSGGGAASAPSPATKPTPTAAAAAATAAVSQDDTKVRTREDARREKHDSPEKREAKSSSVPPPPPPPSLRKSESVESADTDSAKEPPAVAPAAPSTPAPAEKSRTSKSKDAETTPTTTPKRQPKKNKTEEPPEKEKVDEKTNAAVAAAEPETKPEPLPRPESGEPTRRCSLDMSIDVGDRVKVKYGRGRQLKIYEAKVLRIEEECSEKKFYVHYTGWNMRYDEWVRKNRIVENVTDKTSRRKRLQKEKQQADASPHQKTQSGPNGNQQSSAQSANNAPSSSESPTSSKKGVRRGRPPSVSSNRSRALSTTPPPGKPSPNSMSTRASRSERALASDQLSGSGSEPRRRSRRKSGTHSPPCPDDDEEGSGDDDDDISLKSHISIKIEPGEPLEDLEKTTSAMTTDSSEDAPLPPSPEPKPDVLDQEAVVKEEPPEEVEEKMECDDEDTDIDESSTTSLAAFVAAARAQSKEEASQENVAEEAADEEESEADTTLHIEEEAAKVTDAEEVLNTTIAEDEDSLLEEGSLVIFEDEKAEDAAEDEEQPPPTEPEVVAAAAVSLKQEDDGVVAEETREVAEEEPKEVEQPEVVPVVEASRPPTITGTRVITIFPPAPEPEVLKHIDWLKHEEVLNKPDNQEEKEEEKQEEAEGEPEAEIPSSPPPIDNEDNLEEEEELAAESISDVLLLPPSLVAKEGPERDALLAPEHSLPASEFDVCKDEEEEDEEELPKEEEDEDDNGEPSSPMEIVERDPMASAVERIEFVKEESESASTQDFYKVALALSDDGSNSNVLRIEEDGAKSVDEPIEFPPVCGETVVSAAEVEVGPADGGEPSTKRTIKRKKFKGTKTKFGAEAKLKGRKKMKGQLLPDGTPAKAPRLKKCRKVGDGEQRVVKKRKKLKNADGGDDLTDPGMKKAKRKMRKANKDHPEAGKKGKRKKLTSCASYEDSDEAGDVERTFAGKIKREKRKAAAARPSPPFHHDYLSTLAEVCGQEVEMKATAAAATTTESQAESADSLFLLCEEKVPASPTREGDDEVSQAQHHHTHSHHHHHHHHHHHAHHQHMHHPHSSHHQPQPQQPPHLQQQQPPQQGPSKMDIFTSVAEAALAGPSGADPSAAVLDNTPPTTPEDSGGADNDSPSSSLAGSPRREGDNFHGMDGESTMSADSENSRGSADGAVGFKAGGEDDSSSSRTTDSASSAERHKGLAGTKRPALRDEEQLLRHGKRARKAARKALLSAVHGDSKGKTHRTSRNSRDSSLPMSSTCDSGSCTPTSTATTCTATTPGSTNMGSLHRPSKFNFDLPLDDNMDAEKRIAVLQDRLSELRKVYMQLKAEVAVIDRRRKRAKKKESCAPVLPSISMVTVSQPACTSPPPSSPQPIELPCSS